MLIATRRKPNGWTEIGRASCKSSESRRRVCSCSPVGLHRVWFRRHRLGAVVAAAHACAIAGLVLLGLALAGVGVVVFDTVMGRTGAWIAGGATLAAFVTFWFLIPLPLRRRTDSSY